MLVVFLYVCLGFVLFLVVIIISFGCFASVKRLAVKMCLQNGDVLSRTLNSTLLHRP